jgi:hypothetical protein
LKIYRQTFAADDDARRFVATHAGADVNAAVALIEDICMQVCNNNLLVFVFAIEKKKSIDQ